MSMYKIELTPDDNGTFLISCEALPEVTTFCEEAGLAQTLARSAIEEALAARIADDREAPAFASVDPAELRDNEQLVIMPLQTSLKVDLYNALRESGLKRADLQRRLGVARETIDRLFRLDHASRTDQLGAAFQALDYRVEVRKAKPAQATAAVH
jgi:antitoxin HicB